MSSPQGAMKTAPTECAPRFTMLEDSRQRLTNGLIKMPTCDTNETTSTRCVFGQKIYRP
ncbi:MAG: hypothetical protein HRT36_00440 [Alphaproteobacteria bacterium]|nr:hypothetical protein [Alphaproteobacteria bacterium]